MASEKIMDPEKATAKAAPETQLKITQVRGMIHTVRHLVTVEEVD